MQKAGRFFGSLAQFIMQKTGRFFGSLAQCILQKPGRFFGSLAQCIVQTMPVFNLKAATLLSWMALMPLHGSSFLIIPPTNRSPLIQQTHLVGNQATSLQFKKAAAITATS